MSDAIGRDGLGAATIADRWTQGGQEAFRCGSCGYAVFEEQWADHVRLFHDNQEQEQIDGAVA